MEVRWEGQLLGRHTPGRNDQETYEMIVDVILKNVFASSSIA